ARATERAPPESIGVLERQTVRNAPRYAENCVGQSARVGRGPAEFTSAGRGGACRPYETRLERRSVKPIGVLANQRPGEARDGARRRLGLVRRERSLEQSVPPSPCIPGRLGLAHERRTDNRLYRARKEERVVTPSQPRLRIGEGASRRAAPGCGADAVADRRPQVDADRAVPEVTH